MHALLQKAVDKSGPLAAHEAIEWLKEAYGGRLDIMKPQTIYNKIELLCFKNGYPVEEDEIITTVNDYIHN
jgi:hypothetical protein